MADPIRVRPVVGLATLFLGLEAVFASLTLVALSRPGAAAALATVGVVLAVSGLRWLASDSG